ncbi:MAG: hypothetical protein IJ213_03235 [Bacteroidales bacterium]|nr:hypothetical protein [Bacteroidales bacterium]
MKKIIIVCISILFAIISNSQTNYKHKPNKEDVLSSIHTFKYYTTKDNKISYHIFDRSFNADKCCNENIIDRVYGLFQVNIEDSLIGYYIDSSSTKLKVRKKMVYILNATAIEIDSFQSTLPKSTFDTITFSFYVLTYDDYFAKNKLDTCSLGITAYFDRLPPTFYHGYKRPICLGSVYIPDFPLGMLGNFHVLIENMSKQLEDTK